MENTPQEYANKLINTYHCLNNKSVTAKTIKRAVQCAINDLNNTNHSLIQVIDVSSPFYKFHEEALIILKNKLISN